MKPPCIILLRHARVLVARSNNHTRVHLLTNIWPSHLGTHPDTWIQPYRNIPFLGWISYNQSSASLWSVLPICWLSTHVYCMVYREWKESWNVQKVSVFHDGIRQTRQQQLTALTRTPRSASSSAAVLQKKDSSSHFYQTHIKLYPHHTHHPTPQSSKREAPFLQNGWIFEEFPKRGGRVISNLKNSLRIFLH